jgi:hypothetical protein
MRPDVLLENLYFFALDCVGYKFELTLIGCSMKRKHGQAGDMSELL